MPYTKSKRLLVSVPPVFWGKQLRIRFYSASDQERPRHVRMHRLIFATYAAGMREHGAAQYFREHSVTAADISAVKAIRRRVKNAYYAERGRRRAGKSCMHRQCA